MQLSDFATGPHELLKASFERQAATAGIFWAISKRAIVAMQIRASIALKPGSKALGGLNMSPT